MVKLTAAFDKYFSHWHIVLPAQDADKRAAGGQLAPGDPAWRGLRAPHHSL